jgi:hypothetical protein
MLSKLFQPIHLFQNFKGVNSKDSIENIDPGEWDETSINIFSDPRGALGSRSGFTAITSASIGSATAWCGFYQHEVHAGGTTTPHYIGGSSDGKVYEYISNAYSQLYTGLGVAGGVNKRYSFFSLDNSAVIMDGESLPLVWTGTGSAATFASSVTADWGLEWQRYPFMHSTVDPRLIYYGSIGDPDSAYSSFLNFDYDTQALTGACHSGDDMLVGKNNALYRVQYRGTTPLFKIYRINSTVGPVCHWVMKELPGGQVVFLADDCNFYMVSGDVVAACGDNIQDYIKSGVKARLKYAVSGILYERNQYWCSFSYTSGATTNDRTVVMDYSRPYLDSWGKMQFPWFIYSIAANCLAEIKVSGKCWLYHGAYTGLMYKDDNGTNDNGSAFSSTYRSKKLSLGDPTLEKKFDYMALSYPYQGSWNLSVNLVCDGNAMTEKSFNESMDGGLGSQTLWDNFKWDEANWSGESDIDSIREIRRQGKLIQVAFGTTGLNESWLVYNYSLHAKAIGRGIRKRES